MRIRTLRAALAGLGAAACLLLAGPARSAGVMDCETLRSMIEGRIAASGVARFSVSIVAAETPAPGQLVGSCDMGRSKIMYLPAPAGADTPALPTTPASPARSADRMLTECRDGRVSVGGDCPR